MNKVEQNLLIGAFGTAGVDMALEAWFNYNAGKGIDLRDEWLYTEINPWIPPVDDLIALFGVPLGFYLLGKTMRNDSLVQMSKGSAIYGVSEAAGQLLYKAVRETQPALRYRVVR